jgi:thiol-disulfide isomerase/thioredoxin
MERIDDMEATNWVDERLASLQPATEWQPNRTQAMLRLQERLTPTSKHARRWPWAAALACLSLMAFPQPRELTMRICTACLSAAQNFASPEPARPQAPNFKLTDASGQPVTLSALRGKVVLLNFWATWCPPCKMEIPWLIEFQQTYRDQGFVVVGISMDEDGWNAVKPFIDRTKINYPMTIGNDNIATLYGGIESLPTTLIIDRSGRIASTHTGLVSKSDYRKAIEATLDNQ